MRLMHKLTKPFLNEVTWYLDMLNQIEYVEKILEDSEFKIANLGINVFFIEVRI